MGFTEHSNPKSFEDLEETTNEENETLEGGDNVESEKSE